MCTDWFVVVWVPAEHPSFILCGTDFVFCLFISRNSSHNWSSSKTRKHLLLLLLSICRFNLAAKREADEAPPGNHFQASVRGTYITKYMYVRAWAGSMTYLLLRFRGRVKVNLGGGSVRGATSSRSRSRSRLDGLDNRSRGERQRGEAGREGVLGLERAENWAFHGACIIQQAVHSSVQPVCWVGCVSSAEVPHHVPLARWLNKIKHLPTM